MINLSPASLPANDPSMTLVKFLLPLDHDALALPATLGLIDSLCHRGALAHEVVAVDDASRDGTAPEARRFAHLMPLWLIQHGRPRGRAMAFRTALEAACRDAGDNDLLLPIDPRHRPDLKAALDAITAARAGWDAVLAPSGRASWRGRLEQVPEQVAVYRAGLIKRYLAGFLATAPAADADAVRQLEQYLFSLGVRFHRLPAPTSRRPVLHVLPGGAPFHAQIGGRGR
jgi:glycosyltransferase involved in cell wall biosynthesis